MILDRVTITGADDSINPRELVLLSKEFPFAEWGILLSKKNMGAPRFPTVRWASELCGLSKEHDLKLSGHLCGRWVRDLVLQGNHTFLEDQPDLGRMFQRMQLNFHQDRLSPANKVFFHRIGVEHQQYIFQINKENNHLFFLACEVSPSLNIAPLFDGSGGRGILPEHWPEAKMYSGYAGGLGPDNLDQEIPKIAQAAGDHQIWIDIETKVRSEDDRKFDLNKVRRCLEMAAPFVKGAAVSK